MLAMGNVLWGPLYFVFDSAPENQITGWILTPILLGMMALYPIRRTPLSAAVAGVGIALWLIAGVLGWGINV
jgi:hypothetical protein